MYQPTIKYSKPYRSTTIRQLVSPKAAAVLKESTGHQNEREESIRSATQLKQILDARGMFLNLEDYSDDPNFVDEEGKKSIQVIHPKLPQVVVVTKKGELDCSQKRVST